MHRNRFCPRTKRRPILCLILLTLLLLPLPAWSNAVPLFVIQRNKNTNEVHYQLHVDDRCQIVSPKPVATFWKLLHEDPQKTAPLTGLERLAYGVVQQNVHDNWVSFRLRPLRERLIKATARYQPETQACTASVHVEMHEQWAALERVYVHADEGLLDPEVRFIDLIGKSLESPPRPVTERIYP
jgi:hypothetical protein